MIGKRASEPRGEIARRCVVAALIALAPLGGCTESVRSLPADRSARIVYVALGDSTVEGVGATSQEATYVNRLARRLGAVYPNALVMNLGVGGATSADVVARQLPRAVELSPDLVTLSIGPNDITSRVPVHEYEKNLDVIFSTLARKTSGAVVVNLLPDLAVTPRFRRGELQEVVGRKTVAFNEALARKGRQYGAELVDLYRASQEEVPRRPELVGPDGYHPSDAGYARWAELLWAGVEKRIAVR